jgi:hypothetical protein
MKTLNSGEVALLAVKLNGSASRRCGLALLMSVMSAEHAAAHEIYTRKLCLQTTIDTSAETAEAPFASRGTALKNAREIWQEKAIAQTGDVYGVWLHAEDRKTMCDQVQEAGGSPRAHSCRITATPCRSEWFMLADKAGTLRVYDYQFVVRGIGLDGTVRLPQVPEVLTSAEDCPDNISVREALKIVFYRDHENYLVLCGTDQQLGLVQVPNGDLLRSGVPYPTGAFRLEPHGEPIDGEYAPSDLDRTPDGHAFDTIPRLTVK